MRKIICLSMLLIVCLGSSSELLAKRKAVSGAEVTGTFKSSDNEILIQALGQNKLKIEMTLIYPYKVNGEMSANLGTASGVGMIEGEVAIYSLNESCQITLKFPQPGLLIVTTKNNTDCGFGHNVSADGSYQKTSRAKPKFGVDPR